MELKDIFALMDRFDASPATGLTVAEGGFTLSLEKATAPAAVQAASPAASVPAEATVAAAEVPTGDFIKAPLVGTFYSASAPDQDTFAPVGKQIKKGETVCVLEAMKMMSEVCAPADCVIEEVLVSDGGLVGFQEPLFRVRFL
ncbi:MAG: acetyl-CoA carboxylase biotin carboxyl carrier protein subunit [Clostridia bacterium]|nr:acetyl-CoA carboxylase biotin carboxyl carrier protein subunit [Clostridia bacterium]